MRRKDREITDMQQILGIVDRCKILRLGLFDRDYPYVVPLHYGYEFFENRLVFYMHSATEGHKLALIADNPHVCVELDGDAELISGGEIPCMYGSSFASVIGRGVAEIVTDEKEKIKGLSLLMKHQTGRDFAFTGEMAATVAVIRVTLNDFTAKSRPKQ
ncbi:MAG: pyridoxamine 5'-phosphate oxidase family protein [Clostridia bacterium]|nr:pyridoxamine 5'-phosphate oxidase family protein [Clostridia bacterium]